MSNVFFDRVNQDFSTSLSQIPHLHVYQNTFDTENL